MRTSLCASTFNSRRVWCRFVAVRIRFVRIHQDLVREAYYLCRSRTPSHGSGGTWDHERCGAIPRIGRNARAVSDADAVPRIGRNGGAVSDADAIPRIGRNAGAVRDADAIPRIGRNAGAVRDADAIPRIGRNAGAVRDADAIPRIGRNAGAVRDADAIPGVGRNAGTMGDQQLHSAPKGSDYYAVASAPRTMFSVKAKREQREDHNKHEFTVKKPTHVYWTPYCKLTTRPPVPKTGQAQTA